MWCKGEKAKWNRWFSFQTDDQTWKLWDKCTRPCCCLMMSSLSPRVTECLRPLCLSSSRTNHSGGSSLVSLTPPSLPGFPEEHEPASSERMLGEFTVCSSDACGYSSWLPWINSSCSKLLLKSEFCMRINRGFYFLTKPDLMKQSWGVSSYM